MEKVHSKINVTGPLTVPGLWAQGPVGTINQGLLIHSENILQQPRDEIRGMDSGTNTSLRLLRQETPSKLT
jgi:hypothetical protein